MANEEMEAPVAAGTPDPGGLRRQLRRRLISLAIGTVAAAALAVGLFMGKAAGPPSGLEVGATAPGFVLPSLTNAGAVNLAALGSDRHRPVIVNFFASTCAPCVQETPLLARAARQLAAAHSPVSIVGVDVADLLSKARSFVEQAGVGYPVGVDPVAALAQGPYQVHGLPTSVLVDSSGKIVAIHEGGLTSTTLAGWISVVDPGAPASSR